jgi:hypothetical protein
MEGSGFESVSPADVGRVINCVLTSNGDVIDAHATGGNAEDLLEDGDTINVANQVLAEVGGKVAVCGRGASRALRFFPTRMGSPLVKGKSLLIPKVSDSLYGKDPKAVDFGLAYICLLVISMFVTSKTESGWTDITEIKAFDVITRLEQTIGNVSGDEDSYCDIARSAFGKEGVFTLLPTQEPRRAETDISDRSSESLLGIVNQVLMSFVGAGLLHRSNDSTFSYTPALIAEVSAIFSEDEEDMRGFLSRMETDREIKAKGSDR